MLTFGSWLVEVCGLYFLHTSCRQNHVNPAWWAQMLSIYPETLSAAACTDRLTVCFCRAAAAGYPAANDCLKLYRYNGHSFLLPLAWQPEPL